MDVVWIINVIYETYPLQLFKFSILSNSVRICLVKKFRDLELLIERNGRFLRGYVTTILLFLGQFLAQIIT